MKDVIEEAVRLTKLDEPSVLATVVRTKGSTPQKPGAQLLVRKDGSGIGTLGGGCVEGDIWFAAKEMIRRDSGPEFREYFLNEEIAARDGLVCGGTMYFFMEPLCNNNDFLPYGEHIVNAYNGGPVVGIATIVRSSNPSELGMRLMSGQDGSIKGALRDKRMDKLAVETIQRVSDLGNNELIFTSDGTELFVEGYTTDPTIVLMGGGHIGKATAILGKHLGFKIYVIDDREDFANPKRFPEAESTIYGDYAQGLDKVPINANTFIVIATRGHQYDDYALESAIKTNAGYIGLMGSKRKTLLIYKDLLKKGYASSRLRAIHAPIGLDIGALTPEEIAVSIISEIIMSRRTGTGGSMKMDDKTFEKAMNKSGSKEWPAPAPSS